MSTTNLLFVGLNVEKLNKLRSMDRNDNNKGHADPVTERLEETSVLDFSLVSRPTALNKETNHEDVAKAAAKASVSECRTPSSADKGDKILIAPTSHLQKSSIALERTKEVLTADQKLLEGDENDSSVSSVSSDEQTNRKSGDPNKLSLKKNDGHSSLEYDDRALASKREYNRQNAARARKRAKTQLQDLQQQVQALNMSIAQLKERNVALHQTVQTLKEQNALLAQSQQTMEISNSAAATTASSNASPSIFPTNTTANNNNDMTVQMNLLQLLLATATTSSSATLAQPQQPPATLSLQQQTLYYWLLSQMLQQGQQPQNNAPQPTQQLQSTSQISAPDQLMALLQLLQGQNAMASSVGQGSNDASTKSSYPSSQGSQPPPK